MISDSIQGKQDTAGAISVGALQLTGTSHGRNKIYVDITLQVLKEHDCVILDTDIYVLYGILKTEICHPCFSRTGELIKIL